jgi:catechol 2,3-dioxygenase-like lactoylglutathione lyase family enzyme
MSAPDETDKHDLHGVQAVLFVPDVAATLAYYCDILGFHVDFDYGSPPIHARVSSGDCDGPSAARIRFELSRELQPGIRSCYLFIHVGRALDDLFGTYQSRGVEIVSPPKDRPWGLRQFEVRDCNGYLLTFAAELSNVG